jgi:H+-transporting ATPase
LSADALNTLTFLVLVFSGQANVYLVRERGHLWRSLPGRALLISSLADILIVSLLAIFGILMTPIPLVLVLLMILATALFTFLIDFIKVPVLRKNHGHSG